MKIYLKRKTLCVKHTCPFWLIYWHSMNCWNLETNLPRFSGKNKKLCEWKSTTAMTDIERDWERKWKITRKEEERKESRNSERLGGWNEKEKRRYCSMRERLGPQTEGETHALARIQTPTGKLMAACQKHEWTHLPLALSLFSRSPSFNHSAHSFPTTTSPFLGVAGFCMISLSLFSLHLALALHLSSYLFPPLVQLINTHEQLERTGKNQR